MRSRQLNNCLGPDELQNTIMWPSTQSNPNSSQQNQNIPVTKTNFLKKKSGLSRKRGSAAAVGRKSPLRKSKSTRKQSSPSKSVKPMTSLERILKTANNEKRLKNYNPEIMQPKYHQLTEEQDSSSQDMPHANRPRAYQMSGSNMSQGGQ